MCPEACVPNPAANSLVPSVNVIVADDAGRILLIRRTDNGNWAVLGGAIDLGESMIDAAERETGEESSITCEITGLVGIFTDPATSSTTPATTKYARSSQSCSAATPSAVSRRRAAKQATCSGSSPHDYPNCRWTVPCGCGWPSTSVTSHRADSSTSDSARYDTKRNIFTQR